MIDVTALPLRDYLRARRDEVDQALSRALPGAAGRLTIIHEAMR